MSWVRDPELEELLSEPGLRETVRLLQQTPRPAPQPNPMFQAALRRRLMEEAARRQQVRRPWWRRLADGKPALPSPIPRPALAGMSALLGPPRMAAAAAGVGVALVALVLVLVNGVTAPSGGSATMVQYQSPLENAQSVGLVTPIQLTFNQPMDHQAVERAVQIQPATRATYQWRGNTLEIKPVTSLAPNTRYRVTVGKAATTVTGKRLSGTPTVTFTTTNQSSSTAGGGSVASAPTPPVGGMRQLGTAGDPIVRWSADGSTLYLVDREGRLESMPASGGPAQPLSSGGGVTMIAVGPDGVAYVQNGDVHYSGRSIEGVDPVAIGFRSGLLLLVKGTSVQDTDGDQVARLAERPRAADFSPTGAQLAYMGSSGLHLVDLGSGNDVVVGAASSLGGWSPDGRRYAFLRDGGLYVTDGTQSTRLTDASGVTGVSWSSAGQLLLASPNGLEIVNSDGTQAGSMSGAFAQPQWSPGGSSFAVKRGGSLWVGQVTGGHRRPQPGPTPTATQSGPHSPGDSDSPSPSASASAPGSPSPSSSPSDSPTPCPSPGGGVTGIGASTVDQTLCLGLSASPDGQPNGLGHRLRGHGHS